MENFLKSHGKENIGENERMISSTGGAFLLLSGLSSLGKRPIWSLIKAATGGYLLYRGATGHCHITEYMSEMKTQGTTGGPVTIDETITVNLPSFEVYNFWRKLENLPKFMHHIKSVEQIDDTHSRWKAEIPGGLGTLEWRAEILQEREGELLSWQSIPGASVENSGRVEFKNLAGNRGTEIHAVITYSPPAGKAGELASKWLNPLFEKLVKADLNRFKQTMESKESRTTV